MRTKITLHDLQEMQQQDSSLSSILGLITDMKIEIEQLTETASRNQETIRCLSDTNLQLRRRNKEFQSANNDLLFRCRNLQQLTVAKT